MTTTQRAPMRPFDARANIDGACAFLEDYVDRSGMARVVLGLSGGIDSAVVAFLAVRALGPARVVLVRMPYGLMAPSAHPSSSPDSLVDAQRVIDALPGAAYVTVDVAPMVDAFAAALARGAEVLRQFGLPNRWPEIEAPANCAILGNLKARARAVVLRAMANQYRGLVLGTENRSENLTGYFTIGGDEETDIEILSGYYKTEVRALARALGVPQPILDKAPSADLWVGHADETELGVTYADMDLVFSVGEQLDVLTAPAAYRDLPGMTGLPAAVVHTVLDRVKATQFKRTPRPIYHGTFPSDQQET
jgi:NAD+ synthase